MNMKKIIAAVAATAIAVSALATNAFAADLAGSAKISLYAGNNVDWVTAVSDPVTLDKEGTYTVSLSGLAIDVATLTVIYIKDAAVEAGEATKTEVGDIAITTDSVKINGTEMALTEGYNVALSDAGVFDVAYYNIWADNFIDITGIEQINTVEVTFTVAIAAGDATADGATDAAADDATVGDTDVATDGASKDAADTGVEGVAAIAGLALVATGAIIVAKKRK